MYIRPYFSGNRKTSCALHSRANLKTSSSLDALCLIKSNQRSQNNEELLFVFIFMRQLNFVLILPRCLPDGGVQYITKS